MGEFSSAPKRVSLTGEERAVLAGLVAETADVDSDLIEAPEHIWASLRKKFTLEEFTDAVTEPNNSIDIWGEE